MFSKNYSALSKETVSHNLCHSWTIRYVVKFVKADSLHPTLPKSEQEMHLTMAEEIVSPVL